MAFSTGADYERKVDSYLKSSSKLNALETGRLELQLKKLCEKEQWSKERNRELIRDFERVAQQALVLDTRTQRLKAAKKKYEDFINLMYPRWKEELERHRFQAQSDRKKFAENAVYQRRSSEYEHRLTSFPLQSNRNTSGSNRMPSSWPSPGVGGNIFPPSQLDKNNNQRSFDEGPRYRHIGENPYWNQNPPRNQNFNREFIGQTHSAPYGPMSGSYQENYQEPLNKTVVRNNHERHGYLDSEMPHGRPHPQSNYPYTNPHHQRQQTQFGSSIKPGYRVLQNTEYDHGKDLDDDQFSHLFENRMEGHYTRNRQDAFVPTDHDYNMHRRPGYGVDYGPEYRGKTDRYHEPVRNGLERPVATSDRAISDHWSGNEDQRQHHKNYQFQGQPEVLQRHSEPPHDLVDGRVNKQLTEVKPTQDNRRYHRNNEPIEPSKSTVNHYKSGRKEINTNSSGILHPDSTHLADQRDKKEREEEDIISRGVEDLGQLSGPANEGGKGQEADDLLVQSSDVRRHQDNTVDTINVMDEQKRDVPDGIEINNVHSSTLNDETDSNEDYVFPPSENSTINSQGVLVEPSKSGQYLSKEPKTFNKTAKETSTSMLAQRPPSCDSSTEWTVVQSGDGDFEEVSELSLPDGTEDKGPTFNNTASAEHRGDQGVENPREEKSVIKSKSEAVSGISIVIEKGMNTRSKLESNASDAAISNDENEFVDRNSKKTSENAVKHQADNKTWDHSAQSTVPLPESAEIENIEGEKLPSVSEKTLLRLIQLVNGDLEVSFSPESIYRSPVCSKDMREEIVKCSESGASLENFDPSTISMIILEELPLLVRNNPSAPLFSDATIKSSSKFQGEKELRNHIGSSFRTIWKALFSHFVMLVVNNVMTVAEVGALFGPLLLQENSQVVSQTEMLLTRLIKDAVENGIDYDNENDSPPQSPSTTGDVQDVLQKSDPGIVDKLLLDKLSDLSEDTSSTFSGTPPIKSSTVDAVEPESRPHSAESILSYDDDFDEDDIPLTKTTAYQKLMSSTRVEEAEDVSDSFGQSGRSKQKTEVATEADDDLERELERSISPPAVTSPRQRSPRPKTSEKKKGKQRPKLSLFDDGLGLSHGSGDLGESLDSEQGMILSSSWKSDPASSLSPPLSPDTGPGYVPSAVEQGERMNPKMDQAHGNTSFKSEPKSTSETVKRKPGFWNHSDTESEVDLQLSTGGHLVDDEIDDFDFYG